MGSNTSTIPAASTKRLVEGLPEVGTDVGQLRALDAGAVREIEVRQPRATAERFAGGGSQVGAGRAGAHGRQHAFEQRTPHRMVLALAIVRARPTIHALP